jgi:hypothetical protein
MDEFPAWERYPLFFVTGAGIWHLVLFPIGLAGLDVKLVALALSMGTMAVSVPHLAVCVRTIGTTISRGRLWFTATSLLIASLWLAIVAASVVFILVKGLYPAGGHDYYNHYFHFYRLVIETGSIQTNDTWYHFYYSKGAGLYFIAMLLTDLLAPQLVTTSFIGCGACIVYALLRRASGSILLPLIGVLMYIGLFIIPLVRRLIWRTEGGAILKKNHELTAVFLIAVIWITYRLSRSDMAATGQWILALHVSIVSVVLLTLPLALLLGLYLAG